MKGPRLRKALSLLLVALLLGALVAPTVAAARAGGGQSSNSGSSGGSSSGGSSSYSGGSSSFDSDFGSSGSSGGGSSSPVGIVIVIVIIVIFMIISKNKGGGSGGSGGGVPPMAPPAPPAGPVSFDAIRASDPNFSEQAFYGRVNEMFMQIQQAWENRNMEPARRFLSAQQFEVLNRGVQDLIRDGHVNKVMDSLHIDRIQPVSVTREGASDYVRIMVTATIIDYTIDERTKQLVNPAVMGDGKTPKTFSEYWMLERKIGAQTKADATIKNCPNCGAPVTDGNYVKCAYCGMQMNDPALDWVLLRIEQP